MYIVTAFTLLYMYIFQPCQSTSGSQNQYGDGWQALSLPSNIQGTVASSVCYTLIVWAGLSKPCISTSAYACTLSMEWT